MVPCMVPCTSIEPQHNAGAWCRSVLVCCQLLDKCCTESYRADETDACECSAKLPHSRTSPVALGGEAMASSVVPTFWLDLFTGTTWQEFLDSGGDVSGFRESRWRTVKQITQGDYLLCYLTGISRFVGLLEVVSPPYRDSTPIWKDELFPCRLRVRVAIALKPETGVPIVELRNQLSIFQDRSRPNTWTGHVRGSPAKWKREDGEAIVKALRAAEQNPVIRPVDAGQLARRPKALKTKLGMVTVPSVDEPSEESQRDSYSTDVIAQEPGETVAKDTQESAEPNAHAEIQGLLLKLGNDLGMNVWVARNDRNREVNGFRFTDLPNLIAQIPRQFDEGTSKTMELIDVLWLKGKTIIAAFEIESTTSIYSGLLRMSDLISMQPNLNIQLYIVAPDERREKVITEVNRPTFSRLSPPMADMCRFISFNTLRDHLTQVAPFVRYLKPDFVEELSESCEADEA
jgi:EVE domain